MTGVDGNVVQDFKRQTFARVSVTTSASRRQRQGATQRNLYLSIVSLPRKRLYQFADVERQRQRHSLTPDVNKSDVSPVKGKKKPLLLQLSRRAVASLLLSAPLQDLAVFAFPSDVSVSVSVTRQRHLWKLSFIGSSWRQRRRRLRRHQRHRRRQQRRHLPQ